VQAELAPWRTYQRRPYATDPARSRGRLHPEPESRTRSPFQRDRDRIIHAAAFRRLKQKTQVFIAHEGDHYRTRLTHSLEVAQIARTVARVLGLDEDLAEAVALAHDLGHPPFGHAGERELAECMEPFGGFDHNAQSLRVLTFLEQRHPQFDGLNLSWETLEGVVKHNGPLLGQDKPKSALLESLLEYDAAHPLELSSWCGLEAQVAALADDIAYNNHDIDDGLRAGLFRQQDLDHLPLVGGVFREVRAEFPAIGAERVTAEAVRRLIGLRVQDLLAETGARLQEAAPADADAVRAAGRPLVAFSEEFARQEKALRSFLMEHMYRHYRVNRMMSKARRVVRELFALFLDEPEVLPQRWRERAGAARDAATARVVCDYIAGMTDAFALQEHRRLFAPDLWP
jgi:dGTPase